MSVEDVIAASVKVKSTIVSNSKLLNWYYMLFLKSTKKVFSEIQARQIKQLPVRQINFDSPTDKALHDSLVGLADKVLELNKRLASFGDAASKEKDEVSNEINRTTDEIDERIYELYGITEKEKQVIETTLATTKHRT